MSQKDDRDEDTKKAFPLRTSPLDQCICGHADTDHNPLQSGLSLSLGKCNICVCMKFQIDRK